VRVQVTDAFGHPQAGVVTRFSLPDTSHGRIAGGTTAERLTSPLGEAEVAWTLPGTVRGATLTIAAHGVPGSLAVTSESVADPTLAAPLVVVLGPATGATGIEAGTALFARFSQHMDSS